MSEPNEEGIKDEEIPEETKEPEYSDMELEALSMGWKPEGQQGDKEFIEAGEYVRRKPLFDKIDSYHKKVKYVEQSLKDLTEHHKKVRDTEYNRAYKDLEKTYRSAMEEGDTIQALEIHDQMNNLQGTRSNELQAEPQSQPNIASAEYENWIIDNDWYEKDNEMHAFADGVAMAYVNKHGQTPEKIIFEHVAKQVKRGFPEKFENPNRSRPGVVGKGDVNTKGRKSPIPKLTYEQESVARRWEKMGVMSKEDYVKELQSMEE